MPRPSPSLASDHSPDQPPLALTDEQLDQIMRCAAPLHPRVRRVFVEHVAYALRGKTIGDGEVFRACREVLRDSGLFAPPPITNPQHHLGNGRSK
jgi:hypothetical protein